MSNVLITGSSSGIGAAIAQTLRAAGSDIIGVALAGADIAADLSTAAGRAAAVAESLARCGGRLDGLVCSAGLSPTVDPAAIVSVNYFGALAFLDGLLPALAAAAPSAAVVLSSTGATQVDVTGHPILEAMLAGDEAAARAEATRVGDGMYAYCASKHAIAIAVRERVMAWGQAGVRINAVAPGPIETPMLQAVESDTRIPEQARFFLPPVGRKGSADEVAGLVEYLLSPRSGFIHGSMIYIDGGVNALTRPRLF